jgi:hypothetical protein
MANSRHTKLAGSKLFADQADEQPTSLNEVDSALYGAIRGKESERQVAKPLPIALIWPDPRQPRRVIPKAVRRLWDGAPAGVPAMLTQWFAMVEEERGGRPFLVNQFLDLEDVAPPLDSGPLEFALLKVVRLAADIKNRKSLVNPITVAERGSTYVIETGERRTLSYHLLFMYDGDPRWEKIPAYITKDPNVWRQASENNARENLNMVGKARQYALLMMDLHKQNVPFQPLDTFAHERHYYAQVAELDAPYGTRERLLGAMGLKGSAEMTRCRQTLSLPDVVWDLADDLDASSRTIEKASKLPEPEAIDLLNRSFRSGTGVPSAPPGDDPSEHKRLLRKINKLVQSIAKGERVRRDEYDELRRWLDDAESRIEFL